MDEALSRVAVVGTSCSGKTTFATCLADCLRVPHIELDALYWGPNWTPRSDEEFRTQVALATSQDRWVSDGNYTKVRDILWKRAVTVIWLNYAFSTIFWRALYRTVNRVVTGAELYSGNRESFSQAFCSRDSILWWVITTYRSRRREYPELFKREEFSHLQVIEFKRPAEAKIFLASLGPSSTEAL